MGSSQPFCVVQHVDQAEGDDAHHVRAERQQEQEEVAVVAAPDAVVDPGAVVVEVLGRSNVSGCMAGRVEGAHKGEGADGVGGGGHLYTVVTDAAVGAARRAVEVAGGTPLHTDLDAPYIHILVQRGPEVVFLILVLIRCGPGPRGRGQQESDFLGRTAPPHLCQPTLQDPPPQYSPGSATHTLANVSR